MNHAMKYKWMLLMTFIVFSAFGSGEAVTRTAPLIKELERLKRAYPEHIKEVAEQYITWADGTQMSVYDIHEPSAVTLVSPSLADQITGVYYTAGKLLSGVAFAPRTDPGRIRYEPFFRKMYGDSAQLVEENLVAVDWMSAIFGKGSYRFRVTKINEVDKKLALISHALEELVSQNPHFKTFLAQPGGSFLWRTIANTGRLSPHSFGIAIDINAAYSHYWQWKMKKSIRENRRLPHLNTIPWEIISIFEQYGFIWGGKWYHYDTMHFEYRPELFLAPL